ncbi:hypothetical protein EDD18DRAFT_1112010 [Armillaria luteobubalina]|uniref:Uncharacterized protein n=1 Tax=Armillaria luteobubalina TaxID=153913 RepID=A0AA39PHZ3_9AGAR|nr:hypothetical protein EDD18DRAFT_1112010 [Armillaria luteobubalina]
MIKFSSIAALGAFVGLKSEDLYPETPFTILTVVVRCNALVWCDIFCSRLLQLCAKEDVYLCLAAVKMSYVGHDIAVCLYLCATYKWGVNLQRSEPNSGLSNGELTHPCDIERYIGDWHCWVIPLPIECILKLDASSAIGHSWTLKYNNEMKDWTPHHSVLER